MYRMPDQYSAGAQVDATAERELREWAFSQPEVDHDFEHLAEFNSGRVEDRRERALTRMESERDPNADFHDRYTGTVWE